MNTREFELMLKRIATGELTPQEVISKLRMPSTEETEFAVIDHARTARKGFPEVVYGQGKTSSQVAEIAQKIFAKAGLVMITRATAEQFGEVRKAIPSAQFSETAKIIWASKEKPPHELGKIAAVCAGTSDIPIAEEAALTAEIMGCQVMRVWDVGVAGIHRLFERIEEIRMADVVVVAAGMDGALPSVIAGLVRCPVIGIPTDTGYGASFGGLAALLTMLNSCAPGLSVVNINAGHPAGYQAALIALQSNREKAKR